VLWSSVTRLLGALGADLHDLAAAIDEAAKQPEQ
jgi:hypothetical protein